MDNIPEDYLCPISQEIMTDPISLPCCGRALSRISLVEWIKNKNTCP